jgi:flagellar biosynthesis/type III secretory pathway protein FliH
MTNNKQQTAVEIFWNQLPEILPFTVDTETAVKLQEAYQQAKEMEIAGKEISYADGYAEGYKRAIENAKYQINKWIDKELKITQQ